MVNHRRTFLVGLGRFAVGAAGLAVLKPRVLYSFPSIIKPRVEEVIRFADGWIAVKRMPDDLVTGEVLYEIEYHFDPGHPLYTATAFWYRRANHIVPVTSFAGTA